MLVSTETDDDLIPLIPMTYLERVRDLAAKWTRAAAERPDDIHARCLAQGWLAELKRLEEGRIY